MWLRYAMGALLSGLTMGSAEAQSGSFDLVVDVPADLALPRVAVQVSLPPNVGAAVLVRTGGETVFKEVYGSRKLGDPGIVTTGTPFRLAGATKPFTAAAVLRLVEQHKLQPDDRLARFFDGLSEPIGLVTVEQLLTHQSGLPNYWAGLREAAPPERPDGEAYFTDADILEWLKTVRELKYAPGSGNDYCDTNYALLGMIVEAATGQTFEAALDELILEPAGMDDATLGVADEGGSRRAWGHERSGGVTRVSPETMEKIRNDPRVQAAGEAVAEALVNQVKMSAMGYTVDDQSQFSRIRGDGCLYASVNDLEAWFEAVESAALLSETSLTLMTSGLVEADPRRTHSSLQGRSITCGWYRDEIGGQPRLTNPGATRGFCQTVQWMPETQTAVVVLVNTAGSWSIDEVGERVLSAMAAGG